MIKFYLLLGIFIFPTLCQPGETKQFGIFPPQAGGTGTNTVFTQGSIPFIGASGVYSQNNANFFWDNTNLRLGIGTAAPVNSIQINGASPAFIITNTTNNSGINFTANLGAYAIIQGNNAANSGVVPVELQHYGGNVGIFNPAPSELLDVGGNVRFNHLRGSTGTPSIAVGAGAGAGATTSVVGTDAAGTITVTTAGTPTASAILATLTFSVAYGVAPYCVFSAASSTASGLGGGAVGIGGTQAGSVYGTSTTTTFVLNTGANALAVATYKWTYNCIQ